MNHATSVRFLEAHEVTAVAPISLLRLPVPPRDQCAARLRQQLPPPRASLRVSVIIPAKNEAATLPVALAAQTTKHGQLLPTGSFEIIVLANNCQDATAAVVRRQARRWPGLVHVAELCLPGDTAHVGRARCLLMDEGCARLEQVGQPLGIIASTDADTQVAPDWLAAIQAEIVAGADAVGGRIFTSTEDAGPVTLQRIQTHEAAYRLLCARLKDLTNPAPLDRPQPSASSSGWGAMTAVEPRPATKRAARTGYSEKGSTMGNPDN